MARNRLLKALVLVLFAEPIAFAHPGHAPRKPRLKVIEADSRAASEEPTDEAEFAGEEMLEMALPLFLAQADRQQRGRADREEPPPAIAKAFESFVKLKAITTSWDERYFRVESNGIPDHRMMVGITAWQQQVPIPQSYRDENAWRIPLHPVPARKPMSAKTNFFRGAIALAVNGVPIFNPIKNDGRTDTLLAGELDEFGGHCGRADDYHYHIAPVHLENVVGKGRPIAYALDGYPIYGYEEPDGSPVVGLDSFNGHKDANGNYHYHATKKYPYLNGGFFGEVVERDGQVDPQPRVESPRPALTPLRDAKITDFQETKPGSFLLTYDVRGKKGTVAYSLGDDGSAKFRFTDTNGETTNETYQRREPRGKSSTGFQPVPSRESGRAQTAASRTHGVEPHATPKLTVTSRSVDAKGLLSIDCTCDGKGESPAVEWKDAPPETKSFAISLWHTAPDQEKSYWVVHDIPANVTKLAQNSKMVGKLGLNDKRRAEYDPMCSKGPGLKTYHVTVFALSATPKLDPNKATRAALLEAIKDITLAQGTFDFQYERKR